MNDDEYVKAAMAVCKAFEAAAKTAGLSETDQIRVSMALLGYRLGPMRDDDFEAAMDELHRYIGICRIAAEAFGSAKTRSH